MQFYLSHWPSYILYSACKLGWMEYVIQLKMNRADRGGCSVNTDCLIIFLFSPCFVDNFPNFSPILCKLDNLNMLKCLYSPLIHFIYTKPTQNSYLNTKKNVIL